MEDERPEENIRNVLEQKSLRWVFVGGKGGVGKTTCSSSLSSLMSQYRQGKVLIISTDPAHNLSDAFRQKFTGQPTLVQGYKNLYAMEIEPNLEGIGSELQTSELDGLFDASFIKDLAGSIPGIDEAMSFAEMIKQVQSMDYEVVIFDTAPTGHTLKLLQFPDTLDKALGKLLSQSSPIGGMLRNFSGMMGGGSNPDDQIFGKLNNLKELAENISTQFKDPDLTTFICVCIPEFLSLYETERLVQDLARFEIDSRNIVINQIIFPEQAGTSKLLQARVKMQQKYLDQYYDLYEDFHIIKLPLLEEEVRGVDSLQSFSQNLLKKYEPIVPDSGSEEQRLQKLVNQLTKENGILKEKIEVLQKK